MVVIPDHPQGSTSAAAYPLLLLVLIRLAILPIAFVHLLLDITVLRTCLDYINVGVVSADSMKSQLLYGLQNFIHLQSDAVHDVISALLNSFEYFLYHLNITNVITWSCVVWLRVCYLAMSVVLVFVCYWFIARQWATSIARACIPTKWLKNLLAEALAAYGMLALALFTFFVVNTIYHQWSQAATCASEHDLSLFINYLFIIVQLPLAWFLISTFSEVDMELSRLCRRSNVVVADESIEVRPALWFLVDLRLRLFALVKLSVGFWDQSSCSQYLGRDRFRSKSVDSFDEARSASVSHFDSPERSFLTVGHVFGVFWAFFPATIIMQMCAWRLNSCVIIAKKTLHLRASASVRIPTFFLHLVYITSLVVFVVDSAYLSALALGTACVPCIWFLDTCSSFTHLKHGSSRYLWPTGMRFGTRPSGHVISGSEARISPRRFNGAAPFGARDESPPSSPSSPSWTYQRKPKKVSPIGAGAQLMRSNPRLAGVFEKEIAVSVGGIDSDDERDRPERHIHGSCHSSGSPGMTVPLDDLTVSRRVEPPYRDGNDVDSD